MRSSVENFYCYGIYPQHHRYDLSALILLTHPLFIHFHSFNKVGHKHFRLRQGSCCSYTLALDFLNSKLRSSQESFVAYQYRKSFTPIYLLVCHLLMEFQAHFEFFLLFHHFAIVILTPQHLILLIKRFTFII